MAGKRRDWIVGMALVAGLVGGHRLAGAEEKAAVSQPLSAAEAPSMKVLLFNNAGIADGDLMRAQTETVRIFAAAGVKLVLMQPSGNSDPVPFQFALVVMSGTHAERKSDPSYLMGRVVMTREGPSKFAYAFYDKIAEFAQQNALDSARVLGCVIAHEMGHLLLGSGAHSGDGIMRAPWSFVETYRIRTGVIEFSKEHAAAIRNRLARD
jgi:hypothetical protein